MAQDEDRFAARAPWPGAASRRIAFPWRLVMALVAASAAEGLRLGSAGLSLRAAVAVAAAELIVIGSIVSLVLRVRRRRAARQLADTGALAAVAGNRSLPPVTNSAGTWPRRMHPVIVCVEPDRIVTTAARAGAKSFVTDRDMPFDSLASVEFDPTLEGALPATMMTLTETNGLWFQVRIQAMGQREQLVAFRAAIAARTPARQAEPPGWTPLLAWCLAAAVIVPMMVGWSASLIGSS